MSQIILFLNSNFQAFSLTVCGIMCGVDPTPCTAFKFEAQTCTLGAVNAELTATNEDTNVYVIMA